MKKIFSIFTAALMSASMFAALEPAPDDAKLNGYKGEGDNLVYAIYVEDSIKCNDIVLVGTYNGWTADAAACSTFVAVDGFAGWYVCCVADASEDVQAKPAQLDGTGAFNWDYQIGAITDSEKVRGTATIVPGYSNECDIKAISTSAPLLINVTSWKTNPCTAIFHNYVITLVSPDCNAEEYVVPAISGGFNGWAQDSLTFDEAATYARQQQTLPGGVFTITVKAAEGTDYKFRSAASWGADWSNELKQYVDSTGEWEAYNGGSNFTFGTSTELEYDLGDPTKYSWTNCERPIECDSMDYVITVKVPECENSIPHLMGSFDGWGAGLDMTATENPNEYSVIVRALCTDQFKFNDAERGWDNEIKELDGEAWKSLDNISFGQEAEINIDYSGEQYMWSLCIIDEIKESFTLDLNTALPLIDSMASVSVNEGVLTMTINSTAWNPNGIVAPFGGFVKGANLAGIKGSFKCAAPVAWTEIYPYVIDADGYRWYQVNFVASECADWTAFNHNDFQTMFDDQDKADFVNREIVGFGFVASCGTPLENYVVDLKDVEILVAPKSGIAEVAAAATAAKKVMMNGKMYIVVNGVAYDVLGAAVK